MLSLILTEFKKLKRQLFIILAMTSSLVLPIICTIYYKNYEIIIWKKFLKMPLAYSMWFILPCILGIISTILFYSERKNSTLKSLFIIPVKRSNLLFAKIILLLFLSVIFMCLMGLVSVLGGLLIGATGITLKSVIEYMLLCIYTGVLSLVAMLPIVLIIIISRKGYILPISISILYALSGFVLADILTEIHPISAVSRIICTKLEGVIFSTTLPPHIAALNLIITGILSIICSIWFLNRETV